ncbi:MAG: EAL domain-containing protein [Lachnospiraceae bacterium]|nr:EAL domain-containing protein [Lachnospiraceae bacterium]
MKLLYFDYCALIVVGILIFTGFLRGLNKGRLNGCFMNLLVVTAISIIADIVSVAMDGNPDIPLFFRYVANSFYLMIHNLSTPLYLLYLMILTDTDYKLTNRTKLVFLIPFATVCVFSFINPFTNWLFYFNDYYQYTRGPIFFILYISAAFYIVLILISTFKYSKSLGRRTTYAIGSLIPLMLIAVVVQLINSNLLLEMFANAMSLLLCSTLINRPEDILDTDTGLSNKKACVEVLNRCMTNGKPLQVILINISNYSLIENILGYEGLVKILKIISGRILSTNRINGYFSECYYMGEGKFVLEMDYRRFDKTSYIAHFLNDIFTVPLEFSGMEIGIDAITCVVRLPEDIPDIESMLTFQSDLDSSYFTGEVVFASDLYAKNHYSLIMQVDSIIENAINNHGFEVYYQPIYSIRGDKFNSAEALIRLYDEHFGYISPEFFIPAAEKSGAIHRIGAFVLEEVCSFISSPEFEKLGIDYIEVNLSPTQCMRNDLYKEVLDIMRKYDVDPSRINLEITETAAVSSQETILENMRMLESKGILFSLDDFGTGYSNMDRVSNMNFNIIKLDKSFVNVQRSLRRDIVLDNTINMLKSLGMKIVVEGVETAEILQRFADLQCDYIQGFFFSKPLPKADFTSYIKSHNHIHNAEG